MKVSVCVAWYEASLSLVIFHVALLNNSVLQLHKSVIYPGIIVDENPSYPGQSMLNMFAGGLRRSLSALVTIHRVSLYLSYWFLCITLLFYSLPHLLQRGLVLLFLDSR